MVEHARDKIVEGMASRREDIARKRVLQLAERQLARLDYEAILDLHEKERPIGEKLAFFDDYRKSYWALYLRWQATKCQSVARFRYFSRKAEKIARTAREHLS